MATKLLRSLTIITAVIAVLMLALVVTAQDDGEATEEPMMATEDMMDADMMATEDMMMTEEPMMMATEEMMDADMMATEEMAATNTYLSDADAAAFISNLPTLPASASTQVAFFEGFDVYSLPVASCSLTRVYKVSPEGVLDLWPLTACDDDGNLLISSQGSGHFVVLGFGSAAEALAIPLTISAEGDMEMMATEEMMDANMMATEDMMMTEEPMMMATEEMMDADMMATEEMMDDDMDMEATEEAS